ncbi:unnamed protein product [Brassica oleracea]
MVVNGSVIDAGGATVSSRGLKWLVDCLVSFLSSEDWAAEESRSRSLGEVKAMREVKNQMMEAWKQVWDLSEEVSQPISNVSSKEKRAFAIWFTKLTKFVSAGSA